MGELGELGVNSLMVLELAIGGGGGRLERSCRLPSDTWWTEVLEILDGLRSRPACSGCVGGVT